MAALKHGPGTRFGRLVIVSRDGRKITCRCDCGNVVEVHLANLCTGHTKSCGCLRAEVTAERSYRHGSSRRGRRTRAYESWSSMLKRCLNPECKDWPNYGGRGITVCERWLKFENFLADMGERPPGLSIERLDHNGPYRKENCTWVTRKEQNRNTRRNRLLIFEGKTQTLAQWAEDLGLSHTSILRRLGRGWSVERALSEVPRGRV
jgi:hypothetical protein